MIQFLKYLGLALASTIKFVGGPIAGVAAGFDWHTTALCSTAGMMFTVCIVVFAGEKVMGFFGRFYKVKKFSRTMRFGVKVKSRLGLWGISFLTPFIFTPILGSLLAVTFKFPKLQIILSMLICGLVAGYIQTIAIYYFKALF